MARAVVRSGSYMLYSRHLVAPDENTYTDIRLDKLCNMRIPLSFSVADHELIADIIAEEFIATRTNMST